MQTSNVFREVTPLSEEDCFVIINRVKSEFSYPVHVHPEYELNFIEESIFPLLSLKKYTTPTPICTYLPAPAVAVLTIILSLVILILFLLLHLHELMLMSHYFNYFLLIDV